MKSVRVTREWDGKRLDAAAAGLVPEFSRVMIQRVVAEGGMRLNGTPCAEKRTAVHTEDLLEFEEPANDGPGELLPEKIPLDVLYEDESLLVINKPAGMVVHPGAGNHTGTVVNAVLGRETGLAEEFSGAEDPSRPGIVHRLDKDTSGCLVIAKTRSAMFKLCRSFAEREVSKTYLAIVSPAPKCETEEISLPIGRHPVNRKKMTVTRDLKHGKAARTVFFVEKRGMIGTCPAALVRVRIYTGRTHQIRVHMAYRGSPVIGDSVYGGTKGIPAERQMLHAWKIVFPHPETGREVSLEAPPPADFKHWTEEIRP